MTYDTKRTRIVSLQTAARPTQPGACAIRPVQATVRTL